MRPRVTGADRWFIFCIGSVVWAPDLKSGDLGFKFRFDHLAEVVSL